MHWASLWSFPRRSLMCLACFRPQRCLGLCLCRGIGGRGISPPACCISRSGGKRSHAWGDGGMETRGKEGLTDEGTMRIDRLLWLFAFVLFFSTRSEVGTNRNRSSHIASWWLSTLVRHMPSIPSVKFIADRSNDACALACRLPCPRPLRLPDG